MDNTGSPPERYSKAWFEAKYDAWQRQPRTLKWIELVGLALTLAVLFQYVWKAAWGHLYYYRAYGKAALYYDISFEPCTRVMKEPHPWRNFDNELYWRRMRCEGSDHGVEKHGNVMPTVEEFVHWLFDPYAFSSWVVSPHTQGSKLG